jgi:excisionase family DNA binding protein
MSLHSAIDSKSGEAGGQATPVAFAGEIPLLVSPARAARELSVSRWSVYQLCRANRLRNVRLGRKILIPRAELERFASSLEQK